MRSFVPTLAPDAPFAITSSVSFTASTTAPRAAAAPAALPPAAARYAACCAAYTLEAMATCLKKPEEMEDLADVVESWRYSQAAATLHELFLNYPDRAPRWMALHEITGRPIAGIQSNPVRKDLFLYFLIGAFACLIAGIFL